MDLKKALTLCVALLFFVGFSAEVHAQLAKPQSVRIRIAKPADGGWAAIGDSLVIYVETLAVTTLDSVQIGLSVDTDTSNFGVINDLDSTLVSALMTTGEAVGTTGYTRFSWRTKVAAGFKQADQATLVAQAKVWASGDVGRVINNQSTLLSVENQATYGTVGDQKKIGYDQARPTAALTSVEIDSTGTGVKAWTGATHSSTKPGATSTPPTPMAYKITDEVKVKVVGTAPGAAMPWSTSSTRTAWRVPPGNCRFSH